MLKLNILTEVSQVVPVGSLRTVPREKGESDVEKRNIFHEECFNPNVCPDYGKSIRSYL